MSYRIFITGSGIAREAQELLNEEKCLFEVGDPEDGPEDIARKLKEFDPDGLIVRQGKISGVVQDAGGNLKVICKHGVGTDNIDIDAATRRGIPVMYTPGANYESVAEHALALILAVIRRIPVQDRSIRDGIFDKRGYDGVELFEKTLGLIGFGRVGRRLCELAAPFNVQALVFDPFQACERLPPNMEKVQKVEEIFARADIISLHCPLTAETRGLINEKALSMMKEGAYIVNTARGAIIKEKDLIRALEEGRIGGAALDVFEVEPPDAGNPLFRMDNVIVTTHVAGGSDNSLKNMGIDAVKNVLAVLKGEDLNTGSLLNRAVFERGEL